MTWWQKKPYIDVINAYERFSSREKKIVLSTLIIALFLIGYLLVIEPVVLHTVERIDEKNKLVNSNRLLSEKIINTKNKKTQDPNIPLRKKLDGLLVESDELQKKINLLTQALVAPRQMVGLLEKVLTQDKQLKLISLINLPEEAMSIEGRKLASNRPASEGGNLEKLTANEEALIYRHIFEIELEATYDSALLYLKRLDSLPWQIFWQDLEYQSTQYPKGKLNIKIYTLSMSKEVLGV